MRLPINPESKRGVVLGEGKPENQNHAIIFCHNEALQSIDMNQVPCTLHNIGASLKPRSCGWMMNVRLKHHACLMGTTGPPGMPRLHTRTAGTPTPLLT